MKKAGDAIMHLTSPARVSYNFADGNPSLQIPSLAQSWLATEFSDAGQACHIRKLLETSLDSPSGSPQGGRFFPFARLSLPAAPAPAAAPLAVTFAGEQALATFRSGWQPDSAFLGIKGGTPARYTGSPALVNGPLKRQRRPPLRNIRIRN